MQLDCLNIKSISSMRRLHNITPSIFDDLKPQYTNIGHEDIILPSKKNFNSQDLRSSHVESPNLSSSVSKLSQHDFFVEQQEK